VLVFFNIFEPLDTINSLIERLAGVHSFRALDNQLVDVKFRILADVFAVLEFCIFMGNRVKFVVNLFFAFGLAMENIFFLEPGNAVAIQILVKFDFGDNVVLEFIVADLGVVVMKGHSTLIMPFYLVRIYEIYGQIQISNVDYFAAFEILPDK
jgi:hypothetical protein